MQCLAVSDAQPALMQPFFRSRQTYSDLIQTFFQGLQLYSYGFALIQALSEHTVIFMPKATVLQMSKSMTVVNAHHSGVQLLRSRGHSHARKCRVCFSSLLSTIPIYLVQKADGGLNLSSLSPPAQHMQMMVTICLCPTCSSSLI